MKSTDLFAGGPLRLTGMLKVHSKVAPIHRLQGYAEPGPFEGSHLILLCRHASHACRAISRVIAIVPSHLQRQRLGGGVGGWKKEDDQEARHQTLQIQNVVESLAANADQ